VLQLVVALTIDDSLQRSLELDDTKGLSGGDRLCQARTAIISLLKEINSAGTLILEDFDGGAQHPEESVSPKSSSQ
jgi:hypothetical protein